MAAIQKLQVRITKYVMDVYMGGAYVHVPTKYEVSLFKPVARRGVHR